MFSYDCGCIFTKQYINKITNGVALMETSEVLVAERSYRHKNGWSTLLFISVAIFLNLLDDARRAYSLCRIYVVSFMILVLCSRSICFPCRALRVNCFETVTVLLTSTMRCKLVLSF